MNRKLDWRSLVRENAVLVCTALAATVAHLLVAGNYGYFLDELYTLACSRHLSLAFVDIPPVAPMLLALNTAVFGDSLAAIHILPSLFSGAAVIFTGLLARELGGGRGAVALAGIAAAAVPVWMALGSLYTYDFLDQFVLIVMFYALVLLVKRENPRIWLAIGAIAGLGLMTKPSMVFFIAALAAATLLTRQRKQLLTAWPWLGLLVMAAIAAPAFVWQARNGFPIAQYWLAYSGIKTVRAAPDEFVLMQIVGMNFLLLPLWATGLIQVLFGKDLHRYRLVGLMYAVLFAVFMATGAKLYMLIPAYAPLLAAGAVAAERFASNRKAKTWRALIPAYACVALLSGALQAPNFMPVLPVESLARYYDTVGGFFGMKSIRLDDNNRKPQLPQYFYDRFEWDVLVRDVAEVYHGLPEDERKDTTVVSQNYGWAGAIDQFGKQYGLPDAMCGQLNYYFFSLDGIGKKTWIMIGESKQALEAYFGEVTVMKVSETSIRQPYQTFIHVCREPLFTVDQAREAMRKFE